jgi:hypothetical protein
LFFGEPDQDSMDSERREDGFVLRDLWEEVRGEFRDISAFSFRDPSFCQIETTLTFAFTCHNRPGF